MLSDSLNNEHKPKSFWKRPEGKVGMAVLAGGVLFGSQALLGLVTTLTALVGQTIMLVILGVVLFILLNIIFNERVQTLVKYMFKSAMRQLTGWFIEIDPIGIMKNYVRELQDKREVMAQSRDKLRGQITALSRQIKQNDDEHQRSMATAKVAHEQGKAGVFKVSANQAGRLQRLNESSLRPLLIQMEVHLRALNKYYEVTGVVIDDLSNEVKAREIERKMILASHSAMKAAKQILNGGTSSKELFDQAMEYVVEDFGMKLGEIESFIENSQNFVETLDVQNGVYQEEAMRKLQEWEKNADSVLLGKEKAKMLEHSAVNSTVFTGIGVPSPVEVDYSELLRKK